MKVLFSLNIVGCDEEMEFPDDITEVEINEAYDEWLQEQGGGWEYIDEELD